MTSQMDQHRGGGGSLPSWLMLGTGLYPAVLTLELKTLGPTTTLLFPNYLRLPGNPVLLSARACRYPTGGAISASDVRRMELTYHQVVRYTDLRIFNSSIVVIGPGHAHRAWALASCGATACLATL